MNAKHCALCVLFVPVVTKDFNVGLRSMFLCLHGSITSKTHNAGASLVAMALLAAILVPF
jgi:hypothetical protein